MNFIKSLLYIICLLAVIIFVLTLGIALAYLIDISKHNSSIIKILEFTGVFIGVVVGALVSIYVFWKGKADEVKTENERLLALEKFVKYEIRGLKIPINKQIKELDENIKKLGDAKDHDYSFLIISNLNTEGIKWINRGELHNLFVLRKSGEEKGKTEIFSEFISKCTALDKVDENLNTTIKLWNDKYGEYQSKWNNDLISIRNQYDSVRTEFERKVLVDQTFNYPFFKEFDKIMGEWSKLEDFKEKEVTVKQFLEPMQTACRKTNGDHFAINILHLVGDCLHTYENIVDFKSFIKSNFQSISDDLKKCEKVFQDAMNSYDATFKTIQPKQENFLEFLLRRKRKHSDNGSIQSE